MKTLDLLDKVNPSQSYELSYEKYRYLYNCSSSDLETQIYSCIDALESLALLDDLHFEFPAPVIKVTEYDIAYKANQYRFIINAPCADSDTQFSLILTLEPGNVFETFWGGVKKLLNWYDAMCIMEHNAKVLTELVMSTLKKNDIDYDISFCCGSGIYNLTDNSLGIRLSIEVLGRLQQILGNTELSLAIFTSAISSTFSSLPCIIECLRRNTYFTKALKIYTRKSPCAIVRGSYHKRAQYLKDGIGYYEANNMLGLIELRTCSDEELEVLRQKYGDKLHVGVNKSPKSTDYYIAKTPEELEALEKRMKKKGISYRIDERPEAGWYNVVFRLHTACAFQFGPVNANTYETSGSTVVTNIFDY